MKRAAPVIKTREVFLSAVPVVTIGITAYNAEKTLARALASARAQDWPAVEIVAVDDASSDGSAAILEAAPDVRVFIQPENKGVAAARNRIIAEARGAYIAFFDDDDESDPDRLTQQMKAIDGRDVICHTARRQIYPGGAVHVVPTLGMRALAVMSGADVAGHILMNKPVKGGYGAMPTCSQMASVALYRRLGGFDESFRRSEDTEFNLRAARAGVGFVGLADPLVTQTMTYDAAKNLEREEFYTARLFEKHRDAFPSARDYDFARAWLGAKYMYLRGNRLGFIKKFTEISMNYPDITVRRSLYALPGFWHNRVIRSFHAFMNAP